MLIAARSGFTVKKKWTNPYVTDGLVAMWDGEWNAGGGVHDPNSTVWKDLAGNYDCDLTTLIGTGSIEIESKSVLKTGYINPSTTYDTEIDPRYWTIEAAIDFLSKDTANVHSGVGSYPVGIVNNDSLIDCGVFNSRTYQVRASFDPTRFRVSTGYIHRDTFSHVSDGYATPNFNTNQRMYYGGSEVSTSHGGWAAGTTMPVQLKAFGSGNTQASFRAYCTRVYNRALTADEIAANYAIDKARFNLPTA